MVGGGASAIQENNSDVLFAVKGDTLKIFSFRFTTIVPIFFALKDIYIRMVTGAGKWFRQENGCANERNIYFVVARKRTSRLLKAPSVVEFVWARYLGI